MFERFLNFILRNTFLTSTGLLALIFWGVYSAKNTAVDAIPDIGQNQVIVLTEWNGQSPKDVEDQITYPLSASLLSVPKAKSVRGKSMFGFSFVQVTFSDDTDYYWARTRVSEQLQVIKSELPEGANLRLGPDSTGLGQVFYYSLKTKEATDLAHLRSVQDYVIKYALQSVPGVSEVAGIGGYKREYQIDVDPEKLRAYGVPLGKILKAVSESNIDIGAKTIEQSEMEFIIRGKGFLGGGKGENATLLDLEEVVISENNGVPLRLKDLAYITQGNGFRRGALDLAGAETVGGIVIMRRGENPKRVIEAVKEKIENLNASLGNIEILPVYDRTKLIEETTKTLTDALTHEVIITILVILLFLLHIKTSLVVASVLPLSILLTFIIMKSVGLDANIMSLAGIAIAIGNMVDMGIVIAERIYSKLSYEAKSKDKIQSIISATKEVSLPLVTATATTVVSFLPVFFLTGRDYKLFAPLAETKTFALLAALLVSLFVVPFLARFLITPSKKKNIVTILIQTSYERILGVCLKFPKMITTLPLIFLLIGTLSWKALKTDDWIALDEGSLFYMPTLYPGVSLSKAMEVLQKQDKLISKIPEVENVLGKIGRADTALDPAPTSMIETYIMLKPKSEWRKGMTEKKIWDEVTDLATFPGVTAASFLQPIEGRVVMLQSGIKASMAIRIYGDDLKKLSKAASDVASQLKKISSVNPSTVNPDIVLGKPYVEFEIDRFRAARYGLSVKEINTVLATALGGKTVTKTVEGRERYPVRVRYQRDYREDISQLEKIPLITPSGAQIPLKAVASLKTVWGPSGISSENARLVAHVAFSPSGALGSLETVEAVKKNLRASLDDGKLKLPTGYNFEAVGSFENQIEANKTLSWIIPLVVFINLLIVYLMFKTWVLSLLIFLGIPLGFGGGMLLLWILGIKLNTAIWVGFIALFGIAIDNGVLLASYLVKTLKNQPPSNEIDLKKRIIEASLLRVRPCLMTTATTILALLPVLLSIGRGAELASSMALPIFAGMFSALLLLLVLPCAFYLFEARNFFSHKASS